MPRFKNFWDSSIFVEVFPSKRTKIYFGKISTYTCNQALKFCMLALFLMQIQNLKSDFRCFDFLLFLGINSETNHLSSEMTFDDGSSDDDDQRLRSIRSKFKNLGFCRKCLVVSGFVVLYPCASVLSLAILFGPIISIIYFVVSVVHFPLHSQDLSVNSVETTNLTEIL